MADKPEHHEDETMKQTEGGEAAAKPHATEAEQPEGFSSPLEFLSAELARIEEEKVQAQDRYLRLVADMENLRKRTQKDVSDAREFSIASFARDMLAVSDNLRRALDALPAEAREGGEAGLAGLIEGVELTERSMLQALERHGVRKITPINERFNANFHQAMFEIPDETVPANTVLQVVQDGFVIGERVLRPAMVGVSKGGPKVSRVEKADAETADNEAGR